MWKLEGMDSGFSVSNRATGTFLFAPAAGSVISTAVEASQWQLTKTKADWSLDGAFYPGYANLLTEGESNFPFRGILRCNYIIDSVTIRVLNEQGEDAFLIDKHAAHERILFEKLKAKLSEEGLFDEKFKKKISSLR